MLSLNEVDVSIGALPILRGVTLEVPSGQLVGLIGRNGAGKTTTLRTIMGLTTVSTGTIKFESSSIGDMEAHDRPALGIGYMPEDRRLVPDLTVEENMLLPSWVNTDINADAELAFIYELMPEVAKMRERKSLLLSGGQQKLVALGRALMAGSKLMLLDEPFEGVAPALANRLSEVIATLREDNRSVLIAQSELTHSASLLDREYVIERGAIV